MIFKILSIILYVLFAVCILVVFILREIMFNKTISHEESKWWRGVIWEYLHAFPEDTKKVVIYYVVAVLGLVFAILAKVVGCYAPLY